MKFLLVLLFLTATQVKAEVIQVPEDCLELKLTPCLVRTSLNEVLKIRGTNSNYRLSPQSILKWIQLGTDLEAELLDGSLYLDQIERGKSLKLNGLAISGSANFVERKNKQLKILDSSRYMLTEYQLGTGRDNQSVVVKMEFLDKKELVNYLAHFFPVKTELMAYLKKHENDWRKEFKAQTNTQTKVLRRSIASVEQDAKLEMQRKEQEEKEIKKVRETFYFRTFFR